MKNNNITRDILISIKNSYKTKISPNSKLFKEYKLTLNGLSINQKERAIGHILGDARIEQAKSKNGHLIKFEWSNQEYAIAVFEEFKEYVITEPRLQKRINKLGNVNITWCFQTIVHPDFDFLGNIFLNNGKKVLHDKVFEIIKPRSLASWFIDDGGINGSHSRGIQFNTQSFTCEEVNKLKDSLNITYEFKAWTVMKRNKYVINIPASEYSKFISVCGEYIYPFMRYKLLIR